MHATGLNCPLCNWHGNLSMTYSCPNCGASLEVSYNYKEVNKTAVLSALEKGTGVWDYCELLPVRKKENIVSLNEGNTPLIKAQRLFSSADISIYLKDETRNPTLSFKDRPNTVGISMAKELGFHDVAIASTGNGAASLSAYSAKCGLICHVFVPERTPSEKIVQALYHGANVIKCPGNYSESFHQANKLCQLNSWANITSTYINPYTMEGDKTIAYEIFSQLGFRVPQWIIIPLGAGPMLSGILKGFEELKHLGFCNSIPKLAGVQAEGCAPIIKAFQKGEDIVSPWDNCKTIAGAIADPLTGYEQDGTRTLKSIRVSNGYGITVSDQEIMKSTLLLAKEEAILSEPASASSIAAINKLISNNCFTPGDIIVSMITAHGLKDNEELINYLSKEVIYDETRR